MPFRYWSSSPASFANGRKKMTGNRISIISDATTTTSTRRSFSKNRNDSIHFFPHFRRYNMVNPSDTYYPVTHPQAAQQTTNRTNHRDKPMEVHIAEATPPKKHHAFSHAAGHYKAIDEKPVYIMATRSPSTLTRSDFSTNTGANSRSIVSNMTELTDDCSARSMWSYSEPNPPKLINVAVESTSHPYAQLCFDPEKKTMVTLMEINLGGGNGRVGRSKRIRIVDPEDDEDEEEQRQELDEGDDEYFDGQIETVISPSGHSSNKTQSSSNSRRRCQPNSTCHEEEKQEGPVTNGRNDGVCSEPIVLSCFGPADGESWLEETDLDLYLLHDCCGAQPWNAVATDAANRQGCAEALKKLLLSSRSLIVFSQRAHSSRSFFWTSSPPSSPQGGGSASRHHRHETFTGIGYTVLK